VISSGVRSAQRGFTLLEIIVVVAIFAVLAAMAYGGLATVMTTRSHIESTFTRMAELQKAYWIMRDDFLDGVARPITDGNDQIQSSMRYDGLTQTLAFTRDGATNPLDLPRSTLMRIGYVYLPDKKRLMRRTWPALDRAPQTKPNDAPLLTDVTRVHWRFLDSTGHWQLKWPVQPPNIPQQLLPAQIPPPAAVELTLDVKGWGKLRWLFAYGVIQLSNTANGAPGGATPGATPGAVVPINPQQIPGG
jgi:general secretion pathway protein J